MAPSAETQENVWAEILYHPWSLTGEALTKLQRNLHRSRLRLNFSLVLIEGITSGKLATLLMNKPFGGTRGFQFLMNGLPLSTKPSVHLHGFLVNISHSFEITCSLTGNVFSVLHIFCGWLPGAPAPTPNCASMTSFCDHGKSFHPSASSVFFFVKYV